MKWIEDLTQTGHSRIFGRFQWVIYVIVGLCLSIWLTTRSYPSLAQDGSDTHQNLGLPEFAVHPLPSSLSDWADPNNSGDYFDQVSSAGFGYLIWSEFPVQIYLDSEPNETQHFLIEEQEYNWRLAIDDAIQEWNEWIPLEKSNRPEHADIIIKAQSPPLRWPSSPQLDSDRSSESLSLPRARTAETTYNIYLAEQGLNPVVMKQRCTILLSPSQSVSYLKATARHELGHALGIWGHSPVQDDVLYFSQVQTPPSISARDINTLKKIYQQPTQLGWPLASPDESSASASPTDPS